MVYDDHKDEFICIYRNAITRPGAEELLQYLINDTDFFTAPASTRHHESREGGLCRHSINVYKRLKDRMDNSEYSLETVAICGLLHDICKVNYYKVDYRNAKNEHGIWERVPYYTVDDKFPYGHGEKSVYLIERFMRLQPDESLAIRWHMGGFDINKEQASLVYSTCMFAMQVHLADMEATYIDEKSE